MASPIVTPDRIGALVDQWRQSQQFERELAERLAGLLESELETLQRRMTQYQRLIEELEKGPLTSTPGGVRVEPATWQGTDTPAEPPAGRSGTAARDYPRYH